jgi:glycosyltransferase involved in cell wall biosynthesis
VIDDSEQAVTHLLIISYDVVDTRMAGPGIRYWEMARALSKRLGVTLATPGHSLPFEGVTSHIYTYKDWSTIATPVSEADVLLLSGDLLADFPQLARCGKPLVMEAAYPYTFENLHLFSALSPDQQMASFVISQETMRQVALAGDFFFCAGQRQRDYWLGVLDASGRINPDTYAYDPTLYKLIDIVPLGLPSRPPEHTTAVMKGVIPGIGATDRVVLWGGGLWQWLDPLSLVRAIAHVVEQRPDVRLVFPGTRHPNPIIPHMPMLKQTVELSDQLGLTNKAIFFGDWVPYERWPNYLLEADIGASLHLDTLETRFAFRTRMLDYIWAGLPMVVTGGDETSELVTRYGLGEVVPPGDDAAIAAAILRLLDAPGLREAYRESFARVRPSFTWEVACEPIARFCERPRFAPDRAAGGMSFQTKVDEALSTQVSQLQHERERLGAEIDRLQALVQAYEQGRFIRLMRWLHDRLNDLRRHLRE